jgi:hypothetical protein
MSNSVHSVEVYVVDTLMGLVASSLVSTSTLNLWIQIGNSFTTDSKIAMSPLQQKYWLFLEITVGATCTKHATCKEQAIESLEEANVLVTQWLPFSTSRK